MLKREISSRSFMTMAIVCALMLLTVDFWAISRWQRNTLPDYSGSLGATFDSRTSQYRNPILALRPDSPLIAAGARVGDGVVFDHRSDLIRYLAKDETIGLTLYRGEAGRHIEVAATADNPERDTLMFFILDWASLVICGLSAMIIAIRRPEPGPQRILCAILLINGVGIELRILPDGIFFNATLIYGGPLLWLVFWQLFVYFALVFPENAPLIRHRWVRRAFIAELLFHAAYACWATLHATQWLPAGIIELIPLASWGALARYAAIYGGLAALLYSWSNNKGVARQKAMWITLSLGVLYLSFSLQELNAWLGSPVPDVVMLELLALARCGAAMLLAYALISRRVFDVGVAMNRALVMAILSSFLLIAFAVTEFAVDKLLHFHGRETNIIIDAAVALGVILSFHRIQHWVNHQVNHIFFHTWHEAAEGMRDFMASATHISDIDALQTKFIAAVARFADVDGVAIYLMESDGIFSLQHCSLSGAAPGMDANDDIVIRLRHARACIALDQQWMFPILVRGEVRGIVAVSAKRSGHPLRTDEVQLLDHSVHQLGLDLESLRAAAVQQRAAVAERAQRTLSQRVADLELACRAQELEAVALRQLGRQTT